MSQPHWCLEHNTKFFKSAKMKHYAHPIVGIFEDGKQVWCNEPDEAKPAPDAPQSITSPIPARARPIPPEPDMRQVSIEAQNAFSGVVALLVSGVIKKEDPLGQTALYYAAFKLNKGCSQGELEKPQEVMTTPSTFKGFPRAVTADEVIAELTTISKSGKMSKEEIKEAVAKLAGGVKGTTIEMVKSLPPEALAKLATSIKPLVPPLVREAMKLGAEVIEPSDIPS